MWDPPCVGSSIDAGRRASIVCHTSISSAVDCGHSRVRYLFILGGVYRMLKIFFSPLAEYIQPEKTSPVLSHSTTVTIFRQSLTLCGPLAAKAIICRR